MPARRRSHLVDLHGYDVVTALDLALASVRDAYLNGYDTVELQHGARSVASGVSEGRGRIKTELRRMADAGRFDTWVESSWDRASSLLLHLRRNPAPRRETWSAPPPRAYPR